MIDRPVLFETTRMLARGWTGKAPTGIDRVCHAYLSQFASRAQAVVQHRGMARILRADHSDELFAMLASQDGSMRRPIMRLASSAWAAGQARADTNGALYLNVSHTDFDLASHWRWVRDCRVNPVYFLHDLIPLTHPHLCRKHAVNRHRGRVVNALRSAAGIVVSTRAVASDLASFAQNETLPVPPVAIASLAGEAFARTDHPAPIAEPYFLCLGTIEPRKNHSLLMNVWLRLVAELGTCAPRLVIVGQSNGGPSPVREMLDWYPPLRPYITVVRRCDDRELGNWLSGAQALLMPTLAEGFGIPLVEALASGKPVIASDLPSLREIGQGIPSFLGPSDERAWAATIAAFGAPGGEGERQHSLLPGFVPPRWSSHFAQVESWLATLPGLQRGLTSLPTRSVAGHGRPSASIVTFPTGEPIVERPHHSAGVRA